MCEAGLPVGLNESEALIVLILNIFFPGIGTLIAACLGDCASTTILVGIAQLLLAPTLIGWVWAICWALNLSRSTKTSGAGVPPAGA